MEVQINKAIEYLKSGGVILYPTDTIWGLGCDATNEEAVKKVFAIKQRQESKSLVTLVSDLDMLARYVKEIPQAALDLIEVNDAPMTIIYPNAITSTPVANACISDANTSTPKPNACTPKTNTFTPEAGISKPNTSSPKANSCVQNASTSEVSFNCASRNATSSQRTSKAASNYLASNVIAEDGSVGIRIPMNEFCRQLCFRFRKPIVSTSANISGENPPKGFKFIAQEVKDAVDYIVHPSMEEKTSTHKASQIIKLSASGQIQIIRK